MSLVREGKSRFRVDGDLTFETVPLLWREAAPAFAAIAGEGLTVDLGSVGRVDSAGLALLVAWVRWAHQRGVRIRFARTPRALVALARAAGLCRLLGLGGEKPSTRQGPGAAVIS
ncbi:MAG TPA: STAS domain-containing protein [Chromatiales bacterium]|nr:STAS domain-containing protein [Chromatiales bacterium]